MDVVGDAAVEQIGGVRGHDHAGPGEGFQSVDEVRIRAADGGGPGGERADRPVGAGRVDLGDAFEVGAENLADPRRRGLGGGPTGGEVAAEHGHGHHEELGQPHHRDELAHAHTTGQGQHAGGQSEGGDEDRARGLGGPVESGLGPVGVDGPLIGRVGDRVVAAPDGDDRAESLEDPQPLHHVGGGGGGFGDRLLSGDGPGL